MSALSQFADWLDQQPVVLQSIRISPASVIISQGTQQQFNATGVFSDGTTADFNNRVAWSASPQSVVVIDNNGLASALAAGDATIEARDQSGSPDQAVYGTSSVTVQ